MGPVRQPGHTPPGGLTTRALRLHGLDLALHPEVYEPAEDSLLLARHITGAPGDRALDLCTGTGLAALLQARIGAQVVATDVNAHACRLARENARRNGLELAVVHTALASAITGTFERITCNPPYLPTAPEDKVEGVYDRALSGGPDGAGVTREAVRAVGRLLAPPGKALLVVSTLQPVEGLRGLAEDHDLAWRELERVPLGMESLLLVELRRR